jgi:hypothetical protein
MDPSGQDKFRCKDRTILKAFNEAYERDAQGRVSSSKQSIVG